MQQNTICQLYNVERIYYKMKLRNILVSSSILFSIGCSSEVIVHGDSIADTANVSEVQAYQLNVKKIFWTDPYVEGVGTGISQVKFIVDGVEKVSVNVSNGKFKVRTSFLGLDSKTKVFEVEGISNTGQIVTTKKCEVLPKLHDAYEMNTSQNYHLGDSYISGTNQGGIDTVALRVNNKVVRKKETTLNSDGQEGFSLFAKDKITKNKDKVEVVGYDSNGNIRTVINVKVN